MEAEGVKFTRPKVRTLALFFIVLPSPAYRSSTQDSTPCGGTNFREPILSKTRGGAHTINNGDFGKIASRCFHSRDARRFNLSPIVEKTGCSLSDIRPSGCAVMSSDPPAIKTPPTVEVHLEFSEGPPITSSSSVPHPKHDFEKHRKCDRMHIRNSYKAYRKTCRKSLMVFQRFWVKRARLVRNILAKTCDPYRSMPPFTSRITPTSCETDCLEVKWLHFLQYRGERGVRIVARNRIEPLKMHTYTRK